MNKFIKWLVFAVVLFPNLAFAAYPSKTATAIARKTATANPTNIVAATQTKVAALATGTVVAATATARANINKTSTAVALLTQGITYTFTRTITPTITQTPVCSATQTQTVDTRSHFAQTATKVTQVKQTQTAQAGYSKTFTPTFTKTATITPTFTITPSPSQTPTIGLTITGYGKNSVSLVWNAPSYTDGGFVRINSTPVNYVNTLNPKTATNLTVTANIISGKNVLDVVSRWWSSSFGVGVTLSSVSSSQTIYNITGIDPITAQNKLNSAGLLVNEVTITAQNAATGYVFVTVYATDRIVFDVRATGATASAIQLVTGITADKTNIGCATGGTVKGMGNFAANAVLDIVPPANALIVPSGTWIGISVTSGSADKKTYQLINCDLADYAKMR